MTTTLVPHTQNPGHTADYTRLTPAQQTHLDQLLEQADTTIHADTYNTLMASAAHLTGVTLTPGADLARCACPDCWDCPVIFDTALPGIRPVGENDDYNLPQLQCPDCSDRHPAVVEQ